ncbi:TPA: acetyl-CoA synthase subunit gamma, partial [Candidatus Bathyarchaeota archaeon]|nr:acetyl-CoA synthase subunit gamma [Candidatus Bathyarchaeota archaeon]
MSKLSPITVYNPLPKKNCGECGVPTCMAFAVELIEGRADLKKCPHLTDERERKLEGLISPPIKTVFIGRRGLAVGGERILHRHELKFFNPTAMFVKVSDLLDDKAIKERISKIKNIELERAGEKFRLDGIALSADSGDPMRFEEAAGMINKLAGLPLILCADEPNVIRRAVEVVAKDKPIVYSAKPDT